MRTPGERRAKIHRRREEQFWRCARGEENSEEGPDYCRGPMMSPGRRRGCGAVKIIRRVGGEWVKGVLELSAPVPRLLLKPRDFGNLGVVAGELVRLSRCDARGLPDPPSSSSKKEEEEEEDEAPSSLGCVAWPVTGRGGLVDDTRPPAASYVIDASSTGNVEDPRLLASVSVAVDDVPGPKEGLDRAVHVALLGKVPFRGLVVHGRFKGRPFVSRVVDVAVQGGARATAVAVVGAATSSSSNWGKVDSATKICFTLGKDEPRASSYSAALATTTTTTVRRHRRLRNYCVEDEQQEEKEAEVRIIIMDLAELAALDALDGVAAGAALEAILFTWASSPSTTTRVSLANLDAVAGPSNRVAQRLRQVLDDDDHRLIVFAVDEKKNGDAVDAVFGGFSTRVLPKRSFDEEKEAAAAAAAAKKHFSLSPMEADDSRAGGGKGRVMTKTAESDDDEGGDGGKTPGISNVSTHHRRHQSVQGGVAALKTTWADVGGCEGTKAMVREVVEWPRRYGAALEKLGTRPPRGILLYGPPGCSKTMIARATAHESRRTFLAVQGPELLSKWLGESERAVRALFDAARASAPSILFFDEIDALAMKRASEAAESNATDRVLTQLLIEVDDYSGPRTTSRHHRQSHAAAAAADVALIAATNRPDLVDDALLRPGRIDRLVYVAPPDERSSEAILALALNRVPCAFPVKALAADLARETAVLECSGADLVALVRAASILAIEANSPTLERDHVLRAALATMTKQTNSSSLSPQGLRGGFPTDHHGRAKQRSITAFYERWLASRT